MVMSAEQQDEQIKAYARVVARAWSDAGFKQQLLANPATVLRENGVPIPGGKQVQVHEDSESLQHFVLPARPTELSDEQLDAAAGGATDPVALTLTSVAPA